MKMLLLTIGIALFVLMSPACAEETITVRSAKELKFALRGVVPGTTIEVDDGTYELEETVKIKISGEWGKPIVLKAKNRGKAVFVGDSRFQLNGVSHFVIEGFEFASVEGPAIELRGCQHVRVTRNIFHLSETKRSSWVMIDGWKEDTTKVSKHNRVDHNLFENKSVLGNFVTIEGTKTVPPTVSQHDRIDRNHFRNIGPRAENVLEAIRIGSSDYTLSDGFTVLEENLFEHCDGDPEYISIKSSRDTVRSNTFVECLGSLSLRHGNGSVVSRNFIFGNRRTGTFLDSTGKLWTLGTGGIRLCGDDMVMEDNYLEGLTGSEWDASFAVTGGDAEYGDGKPLTKHFRTRNAVFRRNTLVDNASGIEVGYNGGGFQGNWWPMAPTGLTFEDNLVVGSADTLIKFFNPPVNSVWKGNIVWPTRGAVASSQPTNGIEVRDPKLVKVHGLWKPNAAGLERVGSAIVQTSRPLTSGDVGPEAD